MKIQQLLIYSFTGLSWALQPVPRDSLPTVVLDVGTIIGTRTTVPSSIATVNKFLGVPYAQPPLGSLRFQPPVAISEFGGPIETTQWKDACLQQFNYPIAERDYVMQVYGAPFGLGPPGESEDCLYLNVYVPETASTSKAVMFWIHGGQIAFGTASLPIYDGSGIAANQDVIVVTINYRTNVFGFSNSPQVNVTSNVGYLDQRLALDWVQRNIASFGGDPKKVTIFGESSGASSVDRLLTTIIKNPPFRGAIEQSGQATVTTPTVLTGPSAWSQLVDGVGCSKATDELACVQSAEATVIQNYIEVNSLGFTTVNDGGITQLATPLISARLTGQAANIPLLIGSNGQEMRGPLGFLVNGTDFDDHSFLTYVHGLFPASAILDGLITAAYSIAEDATVALFDVLTGILTDVSFTCPARIVSITNNNAKVPTWRYYYNATFQNLQPDIPGVPDLGSYHSSEIAMVFGTYPRKNATVQEATLSQFMQKAWADFAKDPTAGPGWEEIDSAGNNIACLGCNGDAGAQLIESSAIDENCLLLNALYVGTTQPA